MEVEQQSEHKLCKACGNAGEDEQHVPLDCPYYAGVYAKFAYAGSKSCLKKLCGHMDQLRVAKFAAACLAKHDSLLACKGSVLSCRVSSYFCLYLQHLVSSTTCRTVTIAFCCL